MTNHKLLDYEVLKIIGTGTYGTCFKVRNKLTDKIFVWKAVDYGEMTEDKKQLLVSEINVLKQLSHPNIVKYFNHIVAKETQTIYIIMECCEGGDLAKLIKSCRRSACHFEEPFVWRVLYQLSRAIEGCHSYRSSLSILHRDIKPANVFLDAEGNIKLGDFGLARILRGKDNFAETQVGTPYYMSPEVIRGTKYNRKSDIWSLGCLIYELCSLRTPFNGTHLDVLSENIKFGQFARIPAIYSSELQNIIEFMLKVEHHCRPTIEVLLRHPTVVSNFTNAPSGFPILLPNTQHFTPKADHSSTLKSSDRTKGPFDRDTTRDLKKEIFSSTRRRILTKNSVYSDPEYVESEREEVKLTVKSASDGLRCKHHDMDPNEITQDIFNHALQQRLIAIKQRESSLKRVEEDLQVRERNLVKRERQMRKLEKMAKEKMIKATIRQTSTRNSVCEPNVEEQNVFKKPAISYDASTMSIEPNESVVFPTTAILDPHRVKRPNGFQRRRVVSFRSPQKRQNPNVENIPPITNKKFNTVKYTKEELEQAVNRLESNEVPKTTDLTKNCEKRKSIFHLFNLNSKNIVKSTEQKAITGKENQCEIASSTSSIQSKWTQEHKKTAFEMLAIMNAAANHNSKNSNLSTADAQQQNDQSLIDNLIVNNKIIRHDRKRQSMIVLQKSHENILL